VVVDAMNVPPPQPPPPQVYVRQEAAKAAKALPASVVYGGVVGGVSGGVAYGSVSAEYGRFNPEPQYAAIKEHDYVQTTQEATTTFAIDVDRASYANVRRFLTANQMPPADAVRVEEMINYFTYSYPQPTGPDPFAVTTEVAGCPWDVNHRLVRIGIQGRNLDEWKMAPNNLVFLL